MQALSLAASRAGDVVAALCAAFREYPVMRFVLGESADYEQRLATLVGLFVAARVLHGEPMLGIAAPAGGLAAADPASAGVSLTTELEANTALYQHFGYELLGRHPRQRRTDHLGLLPHLPPSCQRSGLHLECAARGNARRVPALIKHPQWGGRQ